VLATLRARVPVRFDWTSVLYLAFLAGLAGIVLAFGGDRESPDLRAGPVDPWAPIDKPFEIVSLAGSDPRDGAYLAARHIDGGRRDVVSARVTGGFAVSVGLRRLGTPGTRPSENDALKLIRDRRGALGTTQGRAGRTDSKFGTLETLDVVMRRDGATRRCILFARADAASRVVIDGEVCRDGPAAFDVRQAGCAADRLTLLASGRDDRLASLFQRAELNRAPCEATAGKVTEPRDPAAREVGLRTRTPG
jgi:hypothetical protein